MAHAGRFVFDGFQYDLEAAQMPEITPDGAPTGRTIGVRKLIIVDETVRAEIVFTDEAWDAFRQHVTESRVILASKIPTAAG